LLEQSHSRNSAVEPDPPPQAKTIEVKARQVPLSNNVTAQMQSQAEQLSKQSNQLLKIFMFAISGLVLICLVWQGFQALIKESPPPESGLEIWQ
jgi:multidrug efflux pump subunit AcrB